jgi:hypothetical protein
MKVVRGGSIITVPEGWGVFCHECKGLIESGSECFQEDSSWLNLYHMWCRPREKRASESAQERVKVPRRRMERVPA